MCLKLLHSTVCLLGSLYPNWGHHGRGVFAVNLKIIAQGNWRNMDVREKEKIGNKQKKVTQ